MWGDGSHPSPSDAPTMNSRAARGGMAVGAVIALVFYYNAASRERPGNRRVAVSPPVTTPGGEGRGGMSGRGETGAAERARAQAASAREAEGSGPTPVPLPPAGRAARLTLGEANQILYQRKLRENAARYEERLRALGLTSDAVRQVIEVMTDDMLPVTVSAMLGKPDSLPTADEVATFQARNRELLQSLLGPQGPDLLAQWRDEAVFAEKAVDAVMKIRRDTGPLSRAGEEAAMALTRALHANRFAGNLVGEGRRWTAETETAFRTDRAAIWSRWTADEGAGVAPAEQARIKAWYDQTTEENTVSLRKQMQRLHGQK